MAWLRVHFDAIDGDIHPLCHRLTHRKTDAQARFGTRHGRFDADHQHAIALPVLRKIHQLRKGAAGQPAQLLPAGICSPFITRVKGPRRALSPTLALYSTELRGPM